MCIKCLPAIKHQSFQRVYNDFFCLVASLSKDSLRFFAIGDFGGSPDPPYYTKVEKAVAKRMCKIADKDKVSFTLALGDNFYDDGVKNVKDKRFEVLHASGSSRCFSS